MINLLRVLYNVYYAYDKIYIFGKIIAFFIRPNEIVDFGVSKHNIY